MGLICTSCYDNEEYFCNLRELMKLNKTGNVTIIDHYMRFLGKILHSSESCTSNLNPPFKGSYSDHYN